MKSKLIPVLLLASCAALSTGCTVQPLYGNATGGLSNEFAPAKRELASVVVSEPRNRLDQEVRNELLFLLNGGRAKTPKYMLELATVASDVASEVSNASTIQVFGYYTLSDVVSKQVLADGTVSTMAAYDISDQRQEFALLRAKQDAENRAAREVAHALLANVGAALAKHSRFTPESETTLQP